MQDVKASATFQYLFIAAHVQQDLGGCKGQSASDGQP